MTLPFTVHDGKKSRPCTYEDLFIIVEFGLDATVYSRDTEWWGMKHKTYYGMGTLILLYASIKAILQSNNKLPYSSLTVVDSTRIHRIKCPLLHTLVNKKLIRLIMQIEGLI